MTIYQLRPDSLSQWLTMADRGDFDVIYAFNGDPLKESWVPLRVIPLNEKGMPRGPLTDYPELGTIPTFSRNAVDALRPVLEANGELLPLLSESGEFFAYNVTTFFDALDEERSDLIRFENSRRILKVSRYAFKSRLLESATIFKLPQFPKGRPLVTDDFVAAVRNAGLLGFQFDRLSETERGE